MTCAIAKARSAALAASVVGGLALTACGGGGSTGGDGASSAPSTSAAPPTAMSSPALTGAAAKLQGSWVTTADGTIVALVITGDQAGIFTTGRTVCNGTPDAVDGVQTIHLTCEDGSKDRTTGRVDSVTGTTLKVTWSGRTGQETYTKAEGGKLPSGFPARPER
ncbi:hypothetical protein [Streptomyces sp. NPDC018347]|uniref:hypothetical protein n=1 Tax=Streptomyces sp. NPDC018347 TaxID=3157193 RepID=UPI0033CA5F01